MVQTYWTYVIQIAKNCFSATFLNNEAVSIYIYIYIHTPQKVAICSLWTVCPCFSLIRPSPHSRLNSLHKHTKQNQLNWGSGHINFFYSPVSDLDSFKIIRPILLTFVLMGGGGLNPSLPIFICGNNRKSNKIIHCVDLFFFKWQF